MAVPSTGPLWSSWIRLTALCIIMLALAGGILLSVHGRVYAKTFRSAAVVPRARRLTRNRDRRDAPHHGASQPTARPKPPVTISLVLADDHPLVLRGLDDLFRAAKGFSVLAMCSDGAETLRAVRQHRPDVLVLDLRLAQRDGLGVLHAMQIEGLPTRVVVLTAELSGEEAVQLLRLNAGGVLPQKMAPEALVHAIRKVHGGDRWLEGRSLGQAVDTLTRQAAGEREAAALLTPRELEIARLVGRGLRSARIAQQLNISEGTVKGHLHKTYEKLKISSRVELALYTREKHLVL